MSEEDVARLAAAIAVANGHSDTAEWAAKVVDAWRALGEAPTPQPTAQES